MVIKGSRKNKFLYSVATEPRRQRYAFCQGNRFVHGWTYAAEAMDGRERPLPAKRALPAWPSDALGTTELFLRGP